MAFEVIKDWTTAAGLRAVVIMGDSGSHCGYVGVPQGHPLHGIKYSEKTAALKMDMQRSTEKMSPVQVLCAAGMDEADLNSPEYVFEVHGGLTYSGGGASYPAASDGLWWFGYDCAHHGDSPSDEHQEKMREKYPDQTFMWGSDGVFRDLDYCASECESLASQIVNKTTVHA